MISRLAGILVILAVLFGAVFSGWSARGFKADADISELKREHDQELLERYRFGMEAHKQAEEAGRIVSKAHELRVQELSSATAKLKTELRNAEKKSAARCSLPADWVRLYDQALHPGSDPAVDAAGKPAGAPAGAAAADAGVKTTDEWDVAWIHAENSARCAKCRSQLNALIDYELSKISPAVVTP